MEIRGKKWTNERVLEKIGDRQIQSLDLCDTSADDAVLLTLAERGTLTSLTLLSDRVTDIGIRAVAQRCKLTSLVLHNVPQVTDAALHDIAQCSTLRELYLEGAAVTDHGIAIVGTLPELWSLDISRTQVTDAGIAAIASRHVSLITFDECRITGNGFATWRCEDKMSLYTKGSLLDDEGFAIACKSFPLLWNVIIENTRVTSRGIQAMKGQGTVMMRIHGSPIDREGVTWILDNLPVQSLEVDATQFSEAEAAKYRMKDRKLWLHIRPH